MSAEGAAGDPFAGNPIFREAQRIVSGNPHLPQDELEAALEALFPGQPNYRYYGNPAAEALMRHQRHAQLDGESLAKEIASLRARGKPIIWAYRDRGLTPPWEQVGTPAPEPTADELHQAGRGAQFVALCESYDILFRLHPTTGDLQCSRTHLSPALAKALVPFKAGLIGALRGVTSGDVR